MNEVAVYELKNDLPFEIIHESLGLFFQGKVIDLYTEHFKTGGIYRLPTSLLDGDGNFYETVEDLQFVITDSLLRYDFPEDRWDNFTHEEYEDYEEMIGNHPLSLEDYFLTDMKTTLDSFGLFYLEVETRCCVKTNECREEVIQVHNSPLQEVW